MEKQKPLLRLIGAPYWAVDKTYHNGRLQNVIELDGEYNKIECINCLGEIKGDKVHLSEIQPFSFVCFEAER